ncbi:hypothetical protein GCM10010983_40130 [Caulobacter rhizosphaerae]|nr:hypothetical protein GCM10010983_40130 [Caulobacter rhizosphaerae]
MVICLSFVEGAPVTAPHARAEGPTRRAKCEKHALFQGVTAPTQCRRLSIHRTDIEKLDQLARAPLRRRNPHGFAFGTRELRLTPI